MFFASLRRHMRWIIALVAVAFAGGLFYVGGGLVVQDEPAPGPPVATVNGEPISSTEFSQVYTQNLQLYRQLYGTLSPLQREPLMYQTLQSLIGGMVQVQAAKQAGVHVGRGEVNGALSDLRAEFPDRRAYRDWLRQTGLTESQLRAYLEDELKVRRLREELQGTVEPTEEDLRRAYEQVRVRHILVRPEAEGLTDPAAVARAWEGARSRAEELRRRLLQGEDFAELARAESDDPVSAERGGELGMIGRDNTLLAPAVTEAAFGLEVGEVSEPVAGPLGYHLVQVSARREASGEEFEAARDSLLAEVRSRQGQVRLNARLEELRQQADVVIHDARLLGYDLRQRGQLEAALEAYREALAEDPFDPYLHLSLALVLQELERPEEAIAELESAVEKTGGEDAELLLMLALALRGQGRDEEAAQHMRRAGDLNPWHLGLQQTLAQLYRDMGLAADLQVAEGRIGEIEALREEQRRQQEELERRLRELEEEIENRSEEGPEAEATIEATREPAGDGPGGPGSGAAEEGEGGGQ